MEAKIPMDTEDMKQLFKENQKICKKKNYLITGDTERNRNVKT